MECIKIVTDENYEVSDEAYHTLKRIVKGCEKLIKAYERKLAQREKAYWPLSSACSTPLRSTMTTNAANRKRLSRKHRPIGTTNCVNPNVSTALPTPTRSRKNPKASI